MPMQLVDLIEEVRFARDTPLEGGGFEPSVPLGGKYSNTPTRTQHRALDLLGVTPTA
jgi:hypothetical protein